jgi:hypothetical protein
VTDAKHAPAPWKICYDGQIDAADGSFVCAFRWDSSKEFSDGSNAATARLIAAAPELLAALIDVIGWVPRREAWHTDAPIEAVDRARAAIQKATKEQQ